MIASVGVRLEMADVELWSLGRVVVSACGVLMGVASVGVAWVVPARSVETWVIFGLRVVDAAVVPAYVAVYGFIELAVVIDTGMLGVETVDDFAGLEVNDPALFCLSAFDVDPFVGETCRVVE